MITTINTFLLFFSIVPLHGSVPPQQCGAQGQRPCTVLERIPSCNKGLVEDFRLKKCVNPQPVCGARNQRPCTVSERLPSCDRDLVEDFQVNKCVTANSLSKWLQTQFVLNTSVTELIFLVSKEGVVSNKEDARFWLLKGKVIADEMKALDKTLMQIKPLLDQPQRLRQTTSESVRRLKRHYAILKERFKEILVGVNQSNERVVSAMKSFNQQSTQYLNLLDSMMTSLNEMNTSALRNIL